MIRFNACDYTFSSFGEATEALESLRDQCETFGGITVSDFKTICGYDDIHEVDYDYGWTGSDIDLIYVNTGGNGEWYIDIDEPTHI